MQLTKLNRDSAEFEDNEIENFAILSSKRNKYTGRKRMRNKEIVDTIFIKGLQNFDKNDKLNPLESKIEVKF